MKPILVPLVATLIGSCATETPAVRPARTAPSEVRAESTSSPVTAQAAPDDPPADDPPLEDPPAPPPRGCSAIEASCVRGRCDADAVAHRRPLRIDRGPVSYYADRFHGRRTASGDVYDRAELTAASRTLPFGALVRVRRIDQPERVVVVRINDRGPFGRNGRILDLSRAAAECIAMIRSGVVQVEAAVLDWGPRGAPH